MTRRDGALVLIADDEPLARRRLRTLLANVPWIDDILEASNGDEALSHIDGDQPDLVFLDIRMPGATGLEVLQRTTHDPHVIFTTAFDRHAVTAFELNALDYLLKPFGEERFRQALERAHREVQRDRREDQDADLSGRFQGLEQQASLARVFVRTGGRVVTVPVDEISRFEATGDYVRLHTANRTHLIGIRLGDLETRLDPAAFVRVHRSHIVNLACVDEFRSHPGSRYVVRMRDGEEIVASRRRSREIRRRVV